MGAWALLLCLLFGGCADSAGEAEAVPVAEAIESKIVKTASSGPVLLVFLPHPIYRETPPPALLRVLQDVCPSANCSAAAVYSDRRAWAERWLLRECAKRRGAGHAPHVILAGHSWGGREAAELARRLIETSDDIVVDLLITIDAMQSSALRVTAGAATSVLTLGRKTSSGEGGIMAYARSPRADGRRIRYHVNYYQSDTHLYHGSPMNGATENYRVVSDPPDAVNHGNVDDAVYARLLSDMRAALRRGTEGGGG